MAGADFFGTSVTAGFVRAVCMCVGARASVRARTQYSSSVRPNPCDSPPLAR